MNLIEQNKIYFKDNWGFFIGSFVDNLPHTHYAIQLSISLNSKISITDGHSNKFNFNHFIIKHNVKHQLMCKDHHLLLLINPVSTVGHFLHHYSKNDISEFTHSVTMQLQKSGINFFSGKSKFETLISEISKILETLVCEIKEHDHSVDERIKIAIHYLESNFDRVIPVEEIAEKCALSPSRFLHLFKEKTGVTYRKVQQWNKASKSFELLFKQSLTETAHQLGFTDSSHFTKVFKETFGFNPKMIKKISSFIQF